MDRRHQGPLCVWAIYGDQGVLVGFVMIYGSQMPGFFVHRGDL